MKNINGSYAQHARFWDWGGQDRTGEFEFWRAFAARYGDRVLSPMCALGETGAHLARHGFEVTAFDVVPEMIAEGKKRFGDVEGLKLKIADIRDFCIDMPPADFAFTMDLAHLESMDEVKRAMTCIANHLRSGAGFAVEATLRMPNEKDEDCPMTTYEPFAQVYPGLKVWKTGHCRDDASTGRLHIMQTFYAEDERGNVETFEHVLRLQRYFRREWLEAFDVCGFDLVNEYVNHELHRWNGGDEHFRIFELIKR